jgi:hypothetical protein
VTLSIDMRSLPMAFHMSVHSCHNQIIAPFILIVRLSLHLPSIVIVDSAPPFGEFP